jgi:aspartyl-tRNA(Asn)/glutamyl-tRNA(Gln) amidotransferase subunit B
MAAYSKSDQDIFDRLAQAEHQLLLGGVAGVINAELSGIMNSSSANTLIQMVLSGRVRVIEVDNEISARAQVSDTSAIEAAVAAVLKANPDRVAEYRSGKDKLFGFFVGQVMRAMAGKGNPALVNEVLKAKLG